VVGKKMFPTTSTYRSDDCGTAPSANIMIAMFYVYKTMHSLYFHRF